MRRHLHRFIILSLVLFSSVVLYAATWEESITIAGVGGDDGNNINGAWTGTVVFVGDDGGAKYDMGMRWVGVDVPQNATISEATIKMIARNLVGTITNVHGKVSAHEGDAPAFSDGVFDPNTGFDPAEADSGGVDFDPASFSADVTVYTLDVINQVQEVVNGTWTTGDDMAFRVTDDGSSADSYLRVNAHEDGAPFSPVLKIVYTEGGAPAAVPRLLLLGVGN